MTRLQVCLLHQRICQRAAVRRRGFMLLCLLAELVSGRTCDRAGCDRQRWCHGLRLGSWLLCRQMALSPMGAGYWDWHCLGWAVECLVPTGQRDQAVKRCSSILMCCGLITPFCWLQPSQAKVLTGGVDLHFAQVDIPLSVSHTCIWSHSWAL